MENICMEVAPVGTCRWKLDQILEHPNTIRTNYCTPTTPPIPNLLQHHIILIKNSQNVVLLQ